MKRTTYALLLTLLPMVSFAQDAGSNDFFGNIGKIYVVVGVILILFIGVVGFLVFLERRIASLEDGIE